MGVFSFPFALPDLWHSALAPLQTLCGNIIATSDTGMHTPRKFNYKK
jgi:hypothetical protein